MFTLLMVFDENNPFLKILDMHYLYLKKPVKIVIKSFILLFSCTISSYTQQNNEFLDFSSAQIVIAKELSETQQAAIELLSNELYARSLVNIPSSSVWPPSDVPVIVAGTHSSLQDKMGPFDPLIADSKDEGFSIKLLHDNRKAPTLFIVGNDDRGMLYGIGYFLRKIKMAKKTILIPPHLQINTHPKYALRGHQLGYRPKTNSYDGFDVTMWEQYIRDLIVFGTNAIELVPPNTDDASTSPMFTLPPEEMLIEMTKLLVKYDLQTWIWYPLMHGDYTHPKDIDKSLEENRRIFSTLPKLDAVFIPGGDPGDAPPEVLFDYLEKKAKVLHEFHPSAQMWVSPQGFDKQWMDRFMDLLAKEPQWLTGVVHGPQVRMNVDDFRRSVPSKYPIRRYPDITHNYDAQYPVQDWDFAFAATQNRESINPRPKSETIVFRAPQPNAFTGFITYSEGINDDVNKMIWSALGWDPQADYIETLRDYSRYFIGYEYADDFAQGLLKLEQNWSGPLFTNSSVYTTHGIFQEMEKKASPSVRLNWRFQMALFRSYYDAYNKRRLLYETNLEDEAMGILRQASYIGTLEAMKRAGDKLDEVKHQLNAVAPDWRQRIYELAEALFNSVRMQKSVERYFASGIRRGGNLDLMRHPLNNRLWFKEQFDRISTLEDDRMRLRELEKMTNWTNPGPGGFYDDLGDMGNQPHLVVEEKYQSDPSFLTSPFIGYTIGEGTENWRISWARYIQTLYEYPVRMHYNGLDPTAKYQVKVTYVKDLYGGDKKIRLIANDGIEVHPYIKKPKEISPLVFDVPMEATSNGELMLRWNSEDGMGGTGRGCQIAEVWLVKAEE